MTSDPSRLDTTDRESPPPPEAKRDGEAPTVFDEIRRARSETSVARSVVTRMIGLVVLALAVWVLSRNVTWDDTLRFTVEGLPLAEVEGTIVGDWRSEAVGFRIDADAAVGERLAGAGIDARLCTAFEEAAELGHELRATETEVTLPGGGATVVAGAGAALEGALSARVERIEWRPGMIRALREMQVVQVLPALAFLVLASLCVATRWWRLLAHGGCRITWYDAFRYTYSGLFFNAVVPGINGGDVARAVAVVRRYPDRRSDAFMTVVVDRAIGLVGMILVGTALVLSTDERMDRFKLPVTLFCAAILMGGVLFFHPGLRRLVRFERLVEKLPQGERLLRLDAGARTLLRSPGEVAVAILFSFGNHLFNGLAVFAAARALGGGLGFFDWMTTMAIANTLAAVPISPGGLGVGEVLFGSLAEVLGSTYAIGVATSLVYRLCLYAMSLLGGLVMLLPGAKPIEAETGLSSASF